MTDTSRTTRSGAGPGCHRDNWPAVQIAGPGWSSPATTAPHLTRETSARCSNASAPKPGAGDSWTPRELRTTFVSLLSHQGVSIEEIARLAGHATTRTTEIVYRHELRPVITTGGDLSLNHEGNAAARRGLERLDT